MSARIEVRARLDRPDQIPIADRIVAAAVVAHVDDQLARFGGVDQREHCSCFRPQVLIGPPAAIDSPIRRQALAPERLVRFLRAQSRVDLAGRHLHRLVRLQALNVEIEHATGIVFERVKRVVAIRGHPQPMQRVASRQVDQRAAFAQFHQLAARR
jgi:hypothetical protein